jgi:hypothetical protein
MAKDKEIKYQLPMDVIKSDLKKTVFFAGFVIVFLLILHFGNVTFDDVKEVITGVFQRR